MTTDAKAGLALIVGTIAGPVTMGLHPTGHDALANAARGGHNTLTTAVHVLALAAQPLMLLGTLVLTLRLFAQRELAVSAFVVYALATVAVMVAAAASGLIAPNVLAHYGAAQGAARDAMMAGLHYTGVINQAFAKVYVAFASVAIILWSAAMLRGGGFSRALAVYGVVLSAVLLVGLLAGHLRMNVHGFGVVVVGQGLWMTWTGVLLWRAA
jgi:hypothetical protein